MAYAQIAETLASSLSLQYPPVSVSFTNGVDVPAYSGTLPAGCSFWQKAFEGPVKTSAESHGLCSIGVYTHNFEAHPAGYEQQLNAVLGVLNQLEYVLPADIPQIPVLHKPADHVVYAPLAATPTDPDVVLLFANARQGLIIVEAVQQTEGAWPAALGRPACAVIPQAMNTGRAAVSLGCCGARAYIPAMTDDIALWALPAARLDEYTRRIAALAKANAVLNEFHRLRGEDVAAGLKPTYEESLARLK